MSTVLTVPAPVGLPARPGVTLGRVLAAEWSKAWGLRSTRWTVAVMVLLNVGLAYAGGSDGNVDADGYGSLAYFVTGTFVITQFPLLLLGVLLGSAEFSSRSADPTFVAVPSRTPVLVARTLVTTGVAAITATATLGLSAAAVLLTGLGADLSTELTAETTRMWAGTALYLVAATVLCSGLGMLLRRSSAAVLVAFVVFVLDLVLMAVPNGITGLLPGHAANLITSTDDFIDVLRDTGSLTVQPWTSVGVTAAWAGAVLAGAALRLRSRDV